MTLPIAEVTRSFSRLAWQYWPALSMISQCPILSRWRRVYRLLPAARAGAPTPIVGQARISTVETAERLRQPLWTLLRLCWPCGLLRLGQSSGHRGDAHDQRRCGQKELAHSSTCSACILPLQAYFLGCLSGVPQMQGIQVEPGISQFLRLWAKTIASTRRPTIIAVRSHSLRFMTPAFILNAAS